MPHTDTNTLHAIVLSRCWPLLAIQLPTIWRCFSPPTNSGTRGVSEPFVQQRINNFSPKVSSEPEILLPARDRLRFFFQFRVLISQKENNPQQPPDRTELWHGQFNSVDFNSVRPMLPT